MKTLFKMEKALVSRIFPVLLVPILLFFSSSCEINNPTGPDVPGEKIRKVGDKITDFTGKDQNSNFVDISNFSGKVLLINFSANWCSGCNLEAPALENLFLEFQDRGFQVITLLISGKPSDWAQLHGLSFPILSDSDERYWQYYGEGPIPLNLVIDREGIIRYKQGGYAEGEIRTVIRKYL